MRARLLVFLGAMLAAPFAPADPFAERDVFIRMRDGVRLEADILRPEKSGRFPTLVYRTPYDRRRSRETGESKTRSGRTRPATIRIHHEATHSSRIVLPVVSDGEAR
jgi:predicted acyl esterase